MEKEIFDVFLGNLLPHPPKTKPIDLTIIAIKILKRSRIHF